MLVLKRIIFYFLDNLFRSLPSNFLSNKIKTYILVKLGAEVGRNLYCEPDVLIKGHNSLFLGNNVVISSFTVLTAGGGIRIDDDVMIGYGSKILSQNHLIPKDRNMNIRNTGHVNGEVSIGNGVWIGANVVILPGVRIGKGAVIGAGAVVTKSVEEFSIYVGNPAKLIKRR
ncbi:acyltransferase [Planococcus sp. YIM B11945]|uniref:acyltransferase n=1 Tax=Planococcus sp. YIM B11945 TaxID=3435410 RepID=UPI003D7C73EC